MSLLSLYLGSGRSTGRLTRPCSLSLFVLLSCLLLLRLLFWCQDSINLLLSRLMYLFDLR